MEKLILYSNGCPKCRVIKSKLQAKNISFEEVNGVEELMALGVKTLPVLKIGDDLKDFTQANNWINQQGVR